MREGDLMNKVNLLEEAIGKPVEEWTLDDLQNAKGDYTDVYTDETVEDIINRSSEDIAEIFRCVRVSKMYKTSCDRLESVIDSENPDVQAVIDFVQNSMIQSNNVWDRFVGFWSACEFLAGYNIPVDFEEAKKTISDILNIVNTIHPEPGFEIIMDVVDASNTIAQYIYDTTNINILDGIDLMDELLEKLNLATANMYEVLAKRMVEKKTDNEGSDDE